MKIEKTQTETYILSEVEHCDPITVYVTNYDPGRGKIVIESYCSSYAAFWGSMGGKSLQEFFITTDNDYVIGKMLTNTTQTDFNKLSEMARGKGFDICASNDVELAMMSREMDECFGNYWHLEIPTCSTPEYFQLARILTAVRNAFESELVETRCN